MSSPFNNNQKKNKRINAMLTSVYSAQMSMLCTKLHTWSTVHELISSLSTWHRLGGTAGVVVVVAFVVPLSLFGVCDRSRLLCCTVVGDGVRVFRPRHGDSILGRFTLTGVELKSNGDDALRHWLMLLLLELLLLLFVVVACCNWLDVVAPNDGIAYS